MSWPKTSIRIQCLCISRTCCSNRENTARVTQECRYWIAIDQLPFSIFWLLGGRGEHEMVPGRHEWPIEARGRGLWSGLALYGLCVQTFRIQCNQRSEHWPSGNSYRSLKKCSTPGGFSIDLCGWGSIRGGLKWSIYGTTVLLCARTVQILSDRSTAGTYLGFFTIVNHF